MSARVAGVVGGRMAAAISTAGALGMIGVGFTASADFVRSEARAAASSGRPFGIGPALFLVLDEPEVYGLPPDPVVHTCDLPSMWRHAAAAALKLLGGAMPSSVARH